ncbi:hypothetical protein [Modestobacter sp. NPDC049651]|uniref:hypothetical protein n=1 Tax=unclassified Modestobacter TaxID=2643866 RepID=UPI0033D9B1F7
MTDDATAPDRPDADEHDPFVVQLAWLVDAAGGQGTLARRSKVAERSLRSWSRGDYPKQNDSPAVRRLDAWARATIAGYPTAAGVPALTETSGPNRRSTTEPVVVASAVAAGSEPAEPVAQSSLRRRWSVLAGVVAVLAVAAVVAVVVASSGDSGAAPKPPTDTSALPTRGAEGQSFPEETGSLGANTFADPVKLQDQALKIPPHTTVTVRCYAHAPSIPSVIPDGNWYLIDTAPWTGRWTPANSFMNGDVPGGPTLHNTDHAVPRCH